MVAAAPTGLMALGFLAWTSARAALRLPLWPEGAGQALLPVMGAVPILSALAALAMNGRGRRRY